MRVTKEQIVNGIASYVKSDVIPQIGDDRSTKIILSTAVYYVQANTKLVDSIFQSQFIKMLLDEDGSGTYEIDGLFESISKSIKEHGSFPVEIPPIPFVSPSEKLFSFSEADVSEIKRRIERSN